MPEDGVPSPLRGAEVSIREAQASDIAALVELEGRAFLSDRLTRRRFAALAKSPSASLLVADAGEALLGYVLVLTRRGSRSARLYSLAVAPEAQGGGLGLKLLSAAEAAAEARGAGRLRLEVRTDNEPAVRLYERAGYSQLARQENYYEDGMAALRYGRDFRERSPASMQVPAMGRAA